jgi:hypothetical protein
MPRVAVHEPDVEVERVADDLTSSRGSRCARFAIAAIGAIGLLGLSAPTAFADVTVSGYRITSDLSAFPAVPNPGPSTLVSGANPNAGSYTTFTYSNDTDDLESALTNFGPGLLGNPESVPKCPQAALEAGGAACPPGSQIGTSRLDVAVAAGSPTPAAGFSGQLYNAELLGSEPGRLAAVTNVAGAILVSSIPFTITPRGGGDYGLTGTLANISELDTSPFGDLQVQGLSFIINGSTNSYVRNPTSCELNVSTGQARTYENQAFVDGPPYQFTTFGCEQIPFAPTMSLTLGGGSGDSTSFNKFPPLIVKITQPLGQADELGNKVTLPIELNTNNTAYTLCSQAQADSDSCPAASKFGWATAKSPFLSELVQGPVYLIQQSTNSLPGLLLDLQGRAHVKVQTRTTLINNKRIQSIVTNAPQLPVSELTVALNGGRKTGVFQNREDLCFKGESTTKFNSVDGIVKFYGWNGKNSDDIKLDTTVLGCGPAVKSSLKGATRSRPRLTVTATKHPDAQNMKELRVTLSRNMKLSRSRLGSGGSVTGAEGANLVFVNSTTFRVTGLPAAGASKLTLRLRNGAVRVSSATKKSLRRGRRRGFSVKVKATPLSGPNKSTKTKFRVKGRR